MFSNSRLVYQLMVIVALVVSFSGSYLLKNNLFTEQKHSLPFVSTQLSKKLDSLQLPMSFEANQGQAEKEIKFISHGLNYNLLLADNKATLVSNHKENSYLSMEFLGANTQPKITGRNLLEAKTSYLLGNNSNNWQKEISNYQQAVYNQLYPGIDLVFYGNQKSLEYDLVIAPNTNPSLVKIQFQGLKSTSQEAIKISSQGDLLINIEGETICQHKPVIYQEIAGNKHFIDGSYKKYDDKTIGFSVGQYDRNQQLVIDPEISFSTYLGGRLTDQANAITVDSSGNIYIVGSTSSTNFPTSKPLQQTLGGPFDVFVAKINPNGTSLIYSTYFGGSSVDQGFDIAVDSSGNAYIVGATISSNFPTKSALQAQKGGGTFDGFITKLNPAGNDIVYSTYLGGNDDDQAFALDINSLGNAFIVGSTSSRNFPGVQNSVVGGSSDGFVIQLSSKGNEVVYSRLLGGGDEDECASIVVDSNNNAYITGDTFSNNFPTLEPIQSTLGGAQDAFITKLNTSGGLIYSTYLGGTNNDEGVDITLDSSNNAYITGSTASNDFPTKSAFQKNIGGGVDTFITKVDAKGASLVYSTYLGGKLDDNAAAIGIDPSNNLYVTGTSFSTDFPTSKAIQDKNKGNNDVFLSKLDPTGASLVYSTYLGGSSQDESLSLAVDSEGTAYLAGSSMSSDFPVSNAFQKSSGGSIDAFIVKITDPLTPPTPDFSISIAPVSQTITPGSSTSFTINSKAIAGFNQPISLSVAISPNDSGLSTVFSNSTITAGNSATLTVNAAANTPANAFTITITATSNQIVHTATTSLNLISSDFSISIEPSDQMVVAGNMVTFSIKTKAINGFNQPINLTLSTDPKDSNLTSSFASSTINPDTSTSLSVSTDSNTTANTFTIMIVGMSNQVVHTAIARLTVVAAAPTPDFSINLNPAQLEVTRGQTGTINITITRTGNFSGSVTITSPDTKATKIKLSPAMQTTSGKTATVTFKVKKKAPLGIQQFIFTGSDDSGKTRLAAFAFNIK